MPVASTAYVDPFDHPDFDIATEVSYLLAPPSLIEFTVSITATLQVALKEPSDAIAVITALPKLSPVITPPDTSTTLGLDDIHIKYVPDGSDGVTVAIIASVPPTFKVSEVLLKVIDADALPTVTLQVALIEPSA